MDTILDTLVKHQQNNMGGDDPNAVKDVDPTRLIKSSAGHGNFWDIKPADPDLLAALSPQDTARTASTRGSRRSRLSKSSSRRGLSTRGSSRSTLKRDTLLKSTQRTNAARAGNRSQTGASSPIEDYGDDLGDTRSVMSRTSHRSRASNRSTNSASDTAFDLQRRTRQYIAKAANEKVELEEVEDQIKETKHAIEQYHKNLGGVLALQTNDRNVARQVDIMERRMVKAQNQFMDQMARNNQLRTEVNIWRREIRFLKKANGSIQADIDALIKNNSEREQNMKRMQHEHKAVDEQMKQVKLDAEIREEKYREEWEEMAGSPDALQMELPPPAEATTDRAGKLTAKQEAELKEHVHNTMWEMGANVGMLEAAQQANPNAKAVFEIIAQQTGVTSPEDFADKFTAVETMNFSTYQRVDALINEGNELKQELLNAHRQKAQLALVVQGEDETRHNALTNVAKACENVRDQLAVQRSQYEETVQAANAIRASLNRMMDVLGYGDPDPELTEGSLKRYFGVFEQRLRDVMLRYITEFYKPELQDAEKNTKKPRRHPHRTPQKAELSVSLSDLHKAAVSKRNASPIVPPEAFAIGPTVPREQTRRNLAAVTVPSVDGPKDSRQMAAFVRPWQTGSPNLLEADDDLQYSTRSGASGDRHSQDALPNIEDMFGDRPVSVPVGKSRNRKNSGLSATAPGLMNHGTDRATTAPAESRKQETKLPQL